MDLKKLAFLRCLDYLQFICVFHQQSRSKSVQVFKKSVFLRCLADLQICSSNVIFINNPDPDLKIKVTAGSGSENNNNNM